MVLYAQEKKSIRIKRIDEKVKVDGVLDENFWSSCEIASDFKQNIPQTGKPSSEKTEVRIAYDDNAIYIGAVLYDDKDSMSLTLSQRDDEGNADWFGVTFDPYNAGTIGFSFNVTSAGVQQDILQQLGSSDENWNAVWQSSVSVMEDKWIAEIKIPFSALRFPKENVQEWGINFIRNIRRHREHSHWNFLDPQGPNFLAQLGVMKGIENIDSPLRLSFTPYVSGYIENYNGTTGYTANGGMDVKYGINDAFTLDVTLIPDFGQVQFDNQVLNLSPFEVRFNERRQFFTEGTELFNKADLFYSRRIGGRPVNSWSVEDQLEENEVVEQNPASTQLLNATKLSGRSKKGLGIGLFNAITATENAILLDTITGESREVETGPLSNYSVFVLDQNLKNNSSVTLTNTNVMRNGHTYDANVTGLETNLFTKGQQYNLSVKGSLSQKYYLDSTSLGHSMLVGVGRSAGKLRYAVSYGESSKTYDRNDLGFQRNNNLRDFSGNIRYNVYTPFWRLIRSWSGIYSSVLFIQETGAFSSWDVDFNVGGTFQNFMTAGLDFGISPVKNRDYFEPRVDGRFYENDESFFMGGFWSSDYSKTFALDGNLGYLWFNENGRFGMDFRFSPRLRISDRMMLILDFRPEYWQNEEGVALGTNGIPFEEEDPIFAKRDRWIVTNTVNYEYTFNNRMGLTFRLRHYWSTVEYNSFYVLNEQGQFDPTTYTGLDEDGNSYHNNAFNAFTIDAAYRWVFAPGSELSFVWKNSIFSSSDRVDINYFQNLETLGNNPATNSFSLKILYYIDYWALHQKMFKGKKKD
jgi:hypothetical protein